MPELGTPLADISLKFQVLPESSYRLKIPEIEMTKTKKKPERKMIVVKFQVDDDQHTDPDSGKNLKGSTFKEYFVIEDKDLKPSEPGLRNLKRLIQACLGDDRANASDFNTDELKGAVCWAIVKIESGEDDSGEEQTNNRIKRYIRDTK